VRGALLIVACVSLAGAGRSQAQGTPGSINGRVLCDGAPVRHARVVLESRPSQVTSTDASGSYRFERLTPGSYELHAEKPGFLMQGADSIDVIRTMPAVDVRAGSSTTFDIVFTRGVAIEGAFITSAGLPIGETSLTVAAERLGDSPADASVTTPRRSYDGRFRLHTLAAGRYRLRVSFDSPSAADWFYPGTPRADEAQVLTLVAGQNLSVGEFPLPVPDSTAPAAIPAGISDAGSSMTSSLAGHVVDEFGDPLPWLRVELLQRRFMAGRFRLIPFGWVVGCCDSPKAQDTDDLGHFEFRELAAGDYYLVALPEPFGRSEHPPGQDGLAGVAPTFFPNSEDASGAQPIHVGAGQTVGDIAMTMRSTDTGVLAIRPVDELGQRVQVSDGLSGDALYLLQRGELQPALRARTFVGLDIRSLPAGEYTYWHGAETQAVAITPSLTTPITLSVAKVTPTTVTTGTVSFDAPAPSANAVQIRLQTTDVGRALLTSASVDAAFSDGWNFSLVQRHTIGVMRVTAPKGWALARVSIGDRDVTDVPTEFADGAHVNVLLTNRTGSVTGTVLDHGRPSGAHGVIVFSEDRDRWSYPSRFIHVAHVDLQGTFELDGLLPGRYLAVLLPNNMDEGANPEWLDAMRSSATPVELVEWKTTNVVLEF
jgi:hypothetical protein